MQYKQVHIKNREDIENLKSWPKNSSSLAIAFGNDKKLYSALKEELEGLSIVGASVTGLIAGTKESEEGLSVVFYEFGKSRVKTCFVEFEKWGDGEEVGKKIFEQLKAPDLKGILVLSEGLKLNCSEMVEEIAKAKEPHVSLAGGLAGDVFTYDDIFVFNDKEGISDSAVVAVGFYGDHFHMDVVAHSGITPMGVEREVTKVEDYTIYELDGKPAVEVYKEYFGTDDLESISKDLVKFPFSITNNYIEEGVVRTPLRFSEDKKGIQFTGSIPLGSRVRLMQSASSKFIDGVYDLVDSAPESFNGNDKSLLAISCACRKAVLGGIVDQEAEIICEEFNKEGIVGFYSFGEIASDKHDQSFLYNQTLTLVSIYEE